MAEIIRTESEIDDVLNEAAEAMDTGRSKYPGMSYEEGVREMHSWLTGQTDAPPLGDA